MLLPGERGSSPLYQGTARCPESPLRTRSECSLEFYRGWVFPKPAILTQLALTASDPCQHALRWLSLARCGQ